MRFKFQSAHICKACISKISERAKSKTEAIDLISAVLALFKSIKEYLFPLDLQAYFGQMEYRLLINLNKEFVLRIDNRNIKIDLSYGWGKAIYMILLKYPKGLRYQDFESEKILREFLGIYYRFCSGGDSLESLYRLSRSQIEQKSFRSNLYTYVSKVKKELKSALAAYPDVYKLMDIQVLNGRLLIKINRGFVESHLSGYQL